MSCIEKNAKFVIAIPRDSIYIPKALALFRVGESRQFIFDTGIMCNACAAILWASAHTIAVRADLYLFVSKGVETRPTQ
jgi:hypothetical protein